jgi:3',5'-cyclic AMP phosphodiesterase CpdA
MLIAQISDLHVRPAGQLYGGAADANAHLTGAIRHLHALDRLPDLVILSGDLVEHGAPEEYAQAASRLKDLMISTVFARPFRTTVTYQRRAH